MGERSDCEERVMAEKEYIERDAAIEAIGEALKRVFVLPVGKSIIDKIPAADVRPVILCRDCKCYQQSHYIDKHMECARSGFPVHSVDFCSFGEKREES